LKYLLIVLTISSIVYAEWTSSKETDPITDEVTSFISTEATSDRFSYNQPNLCVRFSDEYMELFVIWTSEIGESNLPTCIGRIDTQEPINYEVSPSIASPNYATFFTNPWFLFVKLIRGGQFAVRFTPRGDDTMTAIFDLHGMTAAAREAGIPINYITAKVDSVNYLYENRFSKTGGVITDNLTSLQWRMGPDSNTNWKEAYYWSNNLAGNWRMPSPEELEQLFNEGIGGSDWSNFQFQSNNSYGLWSNNIINFSTASYVDNRPGATGNFARRRGQGGNSRAIAVRDPNATDASANTNTFRVDSLFEYRFEKIGEFITDNRTVLTWQVGPDYDMYWNEADNWVSTLGENWRLPTIDELTELYDAGIEHGNWGQFENSGEWVWSSTTYGDGPPWAKFFCWDPSTDCGYYGGPAQTNSNRRAFAVFDRFIKQENIITDNVTNLQWIVGADVDTDWNEAKAWVDSLGGDWRLPSMNELADLYYSGIRCIDLGISGFCIWSSETHEKEYYQNFQGQYESSFNLTEDSLSEYFLFGDGGINECNSRTYARYTRAFAVRPL